MASASKAIELSVQTSGRGPAVVLLHGFPLDRTMWDPQVTPLAERFTVVAPDLRGHGKSPAPPGPYTMEQHVADVAALLDRLRVERAALVGLSMGGYIAMNFVARYPDRVWALALADTRPQADTPEGRQARVQSANLVMDQGLDPFVEAQIPRMFAEATIRDRQDLVDWYRRVVGSGRPSAVAAAQLGLAERPDTTAVLAGVRCPVLVVVGEQDAITPPADARLMADLIPGARLEIIPGVGHLANLEAPERFNAALRTFLETAAPA